MAKNQSNESNSCNCVPSDNEIILCLDTNCCNFQSRTECPPDCIAGQLCGNRRIANKQWKDVKVIRCGLKGSGLITLSDIQPGEFIIEYTGERINSNQLSKKYAGKKMVYVRQVNKDTFIDASVESSSEAKFINHSCEPNCCVETWIVDGEERVGVFAEKNIQANNELTFDYGWKGEMNNFSTQCHCGSDGCKGFIEADWLQPKIVPTTRGSKYQVPGKCEKILDLMNRLESVLNQIKITSQYRNSANKDIFNLAWSFQVGVTVGALNSIGFTKPHNFLKRKGVCLQKEGIPRIQKEAFQLSKEIFSLIDPLYLYGEVAVTFNCMTLPTHFIKKHKDSQDISYQYAFALGDFTNAKLRCYKADGTFMDFDTYKNIVKLDGRLFHEVISDGFKGVRYSIICYKNYDRFMDSPEPIMTDDPSYVFRSK